MVGNLSANAGARVRALVREDPTCRRATEPVRHNYWACALEPASNNCWAREPQLPRPVRLEPMPHSRRGHRNERPTHRSEEWPLLSATRDGPRTATKTQCSQTKTTTTTNIYIYIYPETDLFSSLILLLPLSKTPSSFPWIIEDRHLLTDLHRSFPLFSFLAHLLYSYWLLASPRTC